MEFSCNVQETLRTKAAAFMGVAKDTARSVEDTLSTPLPGETLAMFYARSSKRTFRPFIRRPTQLTYLAGEYWASKAHGVSDNRGKMLRRDGFALASERYGA